MAHTGEQSRVFRLIIEDHAAAAMAAFLMAHPNEICGEGVEIEILGNLLCCSCEKCAEERTFVVTDQ